MEGLRTRGGRWRRGWLIGGHFHKICDFVSSGDCRSLVVVVLFVVNYLQFNDLPVYTQMRELAQLVLEKDITKQSKANDAFKKYMK